MSDQSSSVTNISETDYQTLAAFRFELRRFLNFSAQAAKTLGMTPHQHQSLLAIRAAPNGLLSIGDLAEQLFIQPHTASELADRMVGLGWVRKDASVSDRRSMCLGLTPEAIRLLGEMSATHRAEVMRIRETLTELLGRLGH